MHHRHNGLELSQFQAARTCWWTPRGHYL